VNLEPGQIFSGTLRLVRKIADGGMGSVWLAEHLVLKKEVAVKFMAPEWAQTPSACARFLREARITAKIDSPHVVRVLDCRMTECDEPYLVLELLRGENLEQHVRRCGTLSLADLASLVTQTCHALTRAHEAGFVHRDIKPENVFLDAGPPMSIKLLDFGVAKPVRSDECIESDRLPAGTARYMSPEHMFDPEKTDGRSDLFSLAAVAYFALTRRLPFDAGSLEGLYFAIDRGRFDRPTQLRPELPRAIDAWFEKALAHDPAARFANARAMAAALSNIARPAQRDRRPRLFDISPSRPRRSATAAFVLASAAIFIAWHDDPVPKEASANVEQSPEGTGVVEDKDATVPLGLPKDFVPTTVIDVPSVGAAKATE